MFLTDAIIRFYDSALALVYPQPCHVCGHSVETRVDWIACRDCWNSTRIFSAADVFCWKCGALAGGRVDMVASEEVRCRRCEQNAFTAARACGVYEKALRAAVLSLKKKPYVSPRVMELLTLAAGREPFATCTRIVPVPLHPLRHRDRSFNQAQIIAEELSRRTSLPIDSTNLVRTVHTDRHRAGMDAVSRRATVERAFAVCMPRLLRGERILLVDDVFTSGATASACAETMLQTGAEAVFVLTIARTPN